MRNDLKDHLSKNVIGTPIIPLQYLLDKQSFIFATVFNEWLCDFPKQYELFSIPLVEESDWHSDDSVTVSF